MEKRVKLMHQRIYMCGSWSGNRTKEKKKKKNGNIHFVSFNNMNTAFNALEQMSPASLSKFPEFHFTPTVLPL